VDWGNYSGSKDAAVKTAWALLLALYTEIDEIQFNTLTWPIPQHSAAISGIKVCKVSINGATTIGDIEVGVQNDLPLLKDRNESSSLLIIRERLGDIGGSDDTSQQHRGHDMVAEVQIMMSELNLNIYLGADNHKDSVPENLAAQYFHLLHQVTRSGQSVPVKKIHLIGDGDLNTIWTWNAKVPEPAEACIHDMISETVSRQPEALAVCSWDGELTYAQLNDLSTSLASSLTQFGVCAGVTVPLCFEKSMWTPVAMFAVMKAGGASVTYDVTQPNGRLQSIIDQIRPPIVLVSAEQMGRVRDLAPEEVHVMAIDRQYLDTLANAPPCPLPTGRPTDRICVFFTSGSTGIPKGVGMSHSAFASSIKNQSSIFGFNSQTRVYDFVSYAFDVAWFDFIHTFVHGACLCIPSEFDRKNDLAGSIRRCKATFAFLTPTVLRALEPKDIPGLELMAVAGEPLRIVDCIRWLPQTRIINIYGPAECASFVTAIDGDCLPTDFCVGTGLGSTIWLTNPDDPLALVPVGTVGEILVEGPQLGQLYLNEPEKTAAVFLENPPWLVRGGPNTPGRHGRVYRTGDLARYLKDGKLDFIGRKDTQVKIRGQRVELGEVEHHVESFLRKKGNSQVFAEVITHTNIRRPILIAFVVPAGATAMPDDELTTLVKYLTSDVRAELSREIPLYMVPTTYVPLRNIPMTATGKTNRRELRQIASSLPLTQLGIDFEEQHYVSPHEKTEVLMQKIWAEVLNISPESISVEAQFARLGGDSITAMQVVSRCRAHHILLTMTDILRLQTIRSLAAQCRVGIDNLDNIWKESEDNNEDGAPGWDLSPIQKIFFDTNPIDHNHYSQSFILKMRVPAAVESLRHAFLAVTHRHPMLRARIQRQKSGRWEQTILPFSPSVAAFVDHSHRTREEVEMQAQSRQRELNLQDGPVFAVDIFQELNEGQVVLLSAHHAIVDLVSWRVIWHDFQQCLQGNPLNLPTMSFRKWCLLQQREAMKLSVAEVLPLTPPQLAKLRQPPAFNYWGLTPEDNLAVYSKLLVEQLDNQTTTLLLGKANDAFRSNPIDLIVGTLDRTFRQIFTDRDTPTIFIEGHGREDIGGRQLDVSETVGWFTTIYPIPLSLTKDDSAKTAVIAAKDARLSIPTKGRAYFAYRCYNHAEQGLSHPGNFEVIVNFTGRFQQLEDKSSQLTTLDHPIQLEEISPRLHRFGLIELEIGVKNGQLEVSFEINARMKYQKKLHQWVATFKASLLETIQELTSCQHSLTRSDVPLLAISSTGLDTFVTKQLHGVGISAEDVIDIYPCTPLQEGLLLSRNRGAASYANNWIWKCSVNKEEGVEAYPASVDRLTHAWELVINRHSVFTSISSENPETGRAVQIVLKSTVAKARILWLSSGSTEPEIFAESIEPPLAQAQEPEYQVTIFEADNGQIACRLDISHAWIDVMSVPVLVRDLTHAYQGSALPPVPQFRDAVELIMQPTAAEKLQFWKTFLTGIRPCCFPITQLSARDPNNSKTHRSISVHVAGASDRIYEFCKQEEITRSVFLQVVWSIVLSRWLGTNRPCFGYLASGRDLPLDGISDMVAPLINLLIGCVDLSGGLEKAFTKTSRSTIESLNYQHTSLAEIEHELSGQKLFNTSMTVYERSKNQTSEIGLQMLQTREEDPHEVSHLHCKSIQNMYE
jgi:amino acid adenylation domain-containing protein